jgi:hypothetical protein
MKNEELRIGNYINWKGRVVTIDATDFAELAHDEGYFEAAKPVKINHDRLVCLGFTPVSRRCVDGYYVRDMILLKMNLSVHTAVYIEVYKSRIVEEVFLRNVSYIHELQNLFFALAKYELNPYHNLH